MVSSVSKFLSDIATASVKATVSTLTHCGIERFKAENISTSETPRTASPRNEFIADACMSVSRTADTYATRLESTAKR